MDVLQELKYKQGRLFLNTLQPTFPYFNPVLPEVKPYNKDRACKFNFTLREAQVFNYDRVYAQRKLLCAKCKTKDELLFTTTSSSSILLTSNSLLKMFTL